MGIDETPYIALLLSGSCQVLSVMPSVKTEQVLAQEQIDDADGILRISTPIHS